MEVHITDQGQGRFVLDGEPIGFTARHVLIFRGQTPHEFQAVPDSSYRRTVICFDDARLAQIGRAPGMPLLDLAWLHDRPVHHLRLGLSAYQELARLCDQMDDEALLARTAWQTMMLALLTQILTRLQRWAQAQDQMGELPGLEHSSDLVQLGCAYVDQHLGDDLSLHRVADVLHVSEAHLTRSFRLHIGLPFHQYVLAQRIGESRRLLRDRPDLSLTQVAMHLGFTSSSSFSRAFRRLMGQSPSQFRRRGCGEV